MNENAFFNFDALERLDDIGPEAATVAQVAPFSASLAEALSDAEETEASAADAPGDSSPSASVELGGAPSSLSAGRILQERPDVLGGFYRSFYESGSVDRPAEWIAHFGGTTPEDYAKAWYDRHGKWEGYSPTGEAVDVGRLLQERPDVMKAYYSAFFEDGGHENPKAWAARIGGTDLEDFAKYWYDRHGKWEGYTQSASGDTLDVGRLLHERFDVNRAFYQEFYETGAFKKPADWLVKFGGKTAEDFAKYWYDHHGKWEGYSQRAPEPVPLDEAPPIESVPTDPEVQAEDGAEPVGEEPVIALAGAAPDDADLFV